MLRAAKQVDVIPAGARPRLLLGAVADTERHLLVLGLGHGDTHRHFWRLIRPFLLPGDIDELEELESIELPLALAHLLARKQVAGLERQLARDDVLADS